MYYTIYKTTNLVNGKFYIGKHQTSDLNDGYVGSGKLLKRAITKYGSDNFKTEILELCPTEAHMNLAEKIYVVLDQEVSYNLCPGGYGGFGYINDILKGDMNARKSVHMRNKPREYFVKLGKIGSKEAGDRLRTLRAEGKISPPNHTGMRRRDETKLKISNAMKEKQKGKLNSQFGSVWVNNGLENKKIQKDELFLYLDHGYVRGRLKWTTHLFGRQC